MAQNTMQTEAMEVDDLNRDFSAVPTYSANATPSYNTFPIHNPISNSNSNSNNSLSNTTVTTIQPQQQLTAPVVPQLLPTFAATTPALNAIQSPALVRQTSTPQPQMHLNQQHVQQQPIAIPSMAIPLQQTEAMQQHLFVQQQQQQQHIQQCQQNLQQQLLQQQFHHQQQQQQQQQQHYQQQRPYQQQQVFSAVAIPQQMQSVTAQSIIHNLIPEDLQQSSLATATSTNGNGTTTTSCGAPALILPNNNYVNAVNIMFLVVALSANNATAVSTATTAQQMNPSLIPQQQIQMRQHQQQQQQQQPIVSIPLTVQDRPSIIPSVFNGVNLAYPGIEPLGVDPPLFLVRDFLTHAECDFLVRAAEGVWQPAPVVGKGGGEISPNRTSSTCFLAREDHPDYMRKVSALTSKPIDHCELPQVGRYLPSQQYRHVRIFKNNP